MQATRPARVRPRQNARRGDRFHPGPARTWSGGPAGQYTRPAQV